MSKRIDTTRAASLKDLASMKTEKKELFQCRIRAELLERVRKIRNDSNLTWSEVVEYCFEKLAAEAERKAS